MADELLHEGRDGVLVEEGRFRHDLYYRINVIELPVPPLRERRDDIALIGAAILRRMGTDVDVPGLSLSPAALAALQEYPFPGNVRELENILERATALSDGAQIDVADLGLPSAGSSAPAARSTGALSGADDANGSNGDGALPDALERMERERIQQALEACRYNKTRAAAQLGITFRALRYKLKKLGIE